MTKVPQTHKELFDKIEAESSQGDFIYRGESQKVDKVSSNLYRGYKKEGATSHASFDTKVAQKEILKDVKKYTDYEKDIEILTALQHYGGDTNLIDFTLDYRIALVFACYGDYDKNGCIFLLKQEGSPSQYKITRPPKRNVNRVISQKNIFVRPDQGYIDESKVDLINVPVPKEFKQETLEYLKKTSWHL